MADFGAIVSLGVLYAILSLIGRIGKGGKQPVPRAPGTSPRKRVAGKPETLDDLLAEMRGELERAQELEQSPEPEPPPAAPLPAPVVGRKMVNFDDGAAAVVAGRIREAAARNHALTAADHARFDRKIRAVAPVVVVDTRKRDALRKAVVWSEILGTPKGLQDD